MRLRDSRVINLKKDLFKNPSKTMDEMSADISESFDHGIDEVKSNVVALEGRFNSRFNEMDSRLNEMGSRLNEMGSLFDSRLSSMEEKIDGIFKVLDRRFVSSDNASTCLEMGTSYYSYQLKFCFV